jgi:hypothetical protein
VHVAATVVLSVVVRWEPTLTLVNGTLVARPVRLTWHTVVLLAPSLITGLDSSSVITCFVARYRGCGR